MISPAIASLKRQRKPYPLLFQAGQYGAAYAPSNYTSWYQDAARTTAITAVGDPIGSMTDESGNATPSATGLADKATLVSRGWTVTTN